MKRKQIGTIAIVAMLVAPSLALPVYGEEAGKVLSKDEVVYATLLAKGDLSNIYVVNTIDVKKSGHVTDYGNYTSVKNLTDLSELEQEGEKVAFSAPEGKFYYQGNLDPDTPLPWKVGVSYRLDGQNIDPAELAGQSGSLEMVIETSKNTSVESEFYDNYLLQVSLSLPNTYQNIEAPDGMIANAGKNKQITFTVMPGEEETLTVKANVEDFEFDGVEIVGVPSSLPIDTSEMNSMTEDMSELSSAIGELNDGVIDLQDGVAQLNGGSKSVQDGANAYKNGINEVGASSSQLVSGSSEIQHALTAMNQSLSGEDASIDLTSLRELPAGLNTLANGLTEAANGLTALQQNYAGALQSLHASMAKLPETSLTEEEISALYSSTADPASLDKLMATYSASKEVKKTYETVNAAFVAVEPTLTEISNSVHYMSGELKGIAKEVSSSLENTDVSGLDELQNGIATLTANYEEFHSGLVLYTNGVNALSSSYGDLHAGIMRITGGTAGLDSGIDELQDGTSQLYEETKDLPEQMEKEMNEIIQEYDKSDFQPISFVSEENEKVSSVQFILKTESIEIGEPEEKEAEVEEKKGFWTLFLELFK
ncbi:X-X-X-Leu-X-X-Gly heptad repeat-containing protein [Bacillus coahuilensis p1.1.43]|uniref:X-X-X-Leu-X-X-Gly heptad repeat-containing protein n=1 Tax=Bacillus coahuilensis p1.1.43 TaxID=1150625 RepID=A0A147KBZ9_9BACI|nr:YhgE/Pip domain-containing protein [Bacillus coahuilensis]KUP08929.1 X-X-X-Leu-X-X-Gly heptad repeat-containing protein [Bacillus coahuilensis p1.1.43]